MGNLMAGLGLGILAYIIFEISGMFSRYPSRIDGKPAKAFFWVRLSSYLLFAAGALVILSGLF